MTDPESPEHEHGLDPLLFSAFVQMQKASHRRLAKLPEIDRIGLRKAAADAELDLDRQRMSLRERETKRRLRIALTLFAMAYLTGVLLLAPWVIAPTGVAAAIGYLRRRAA